MTPTRWIIEWLTPTDTGYARHCSRPLTADELARERERLARLGHASTVRAATVEDMDVERRRLQVEAQVDEPQRANDARERGR